MPFVVANPFRTSSDCHARAFAELGLLTAYLVGRRRLPPGIVPTQGKTFPLQFVPELLVGKFTRSTYAREVARFGCSPLFDRWVIRNLPAGSHLLAGLGYINRSLSLAKQTGGLAFIEARNSHPRNFWRVVEDEYRRWGVDRPPLPAFHYRRQLRSIDLADYVFSPGCHITNSFVREGFPAERILHTPLPVDTSIFRPPQRWPSNTLFTIVSTGQLSLRKGTPYLLQAFSQFKRKNPQARLLLVASVADNMAPLLRQGRFPMDGVELLPRMPHAQLARTLQDADLFALPSLEEGMLLAAAEAIAVGLPALLTPCMGSADLLAEDRNGSIVPERDAAALAERMSRWHARWLSDASAYRQNIAAQLPDLSFDAFVSRLKHQLALNNLA